MATDYVCVTKIIKERSNANKLLGWDKVVWVAQHNSNWVSEKIKIGFLNNSPVYAYFSPYTHDPNKTLRICHASAAHEITSEAFGKVEFLDPFRAIEKYPIGEPTRRYTLRVVLRACFILRGHTKGTPVDMAKSFTDYFRRGVGFILDSMGGTQANAAVNSSNEEGASNRTGGATTRGVPTASSNARLVAATSKHSPPRKDLPPSSLGQQPLPNPTNIRSDGFTFTEDWCFSSAGDSHPAPSHHSSMSPNDMTLDSDIDVSEAYENNETLSDAEDTPKRGWNSVNKRLANQTVTPSKRRFGMFEEMSTSPSDRRSGPPFTPRKLSPSVPRKRQLEVNDQTDRDKSASPKSVRKSPAAKMKASPNASLAGGEQRTIRLGSPISDETGLVANDNDHPASAKKDPAANAARVISSAASRATNKEQERMSEMFAGGSGTNPGGASATQSGPKVFGASATPSKQKDTPAKPTKAPLANPIPSSSTSDVDDKLFEGMTPARKSQVQEIVRLEDIINSIAASALAHQKSINLFNTCHEQACLRLDDVNDKIERETSGIVNACDEANKRNQDEITRLQQEMHKRAQNKDKQIAQIQKHNETAKLNAEREIQQAKDKTAAKNDELAKENNKKLAAEGKKEEIYAKCERKELFELGRDVGEVLARKRQRRS